MNNDEEVFESTAVKSKKAPFKYLANRIKTAPVLFAVMIVFAAFFIGSGIYFAIIGQSRNCTMSFAFTLIIPAFYVIEGLLRIKTSVVFAIILMFFSAGTIMGACYDVYTYAPVFDTVLHGLWGIVFTVMGFVIIKEFLGEPKGVKAYFACLFFGFMFSLGTALLWELFEYLGYIVGGYDMEEDQIITEFYSYWLSEGHLHIEPVHIEGIAYTVLYNAEGAEILRIEGGYLELGLIDTIMDMAWCFFCSVFFFVIMALDNKLLKGTLYKWLVPAYYGKQPAETASATEEELPKTVDEAVSTAEESVTEDAVEEEPSGEDVKK